jgi:hypothetical protein
MQALEVTYRQQELAARDDLGPFMDNWVALRSGHVVAHAATLQGLLQQQVSPEQDAITYVSVPLLPDQPG